MNENKALKNKEILIYSFAALGQGMIYTTMSSYLTDFYLNILHLGPVFVLMLMLLSRVWDAINDPIMGIVVDKLNFKRGKYKSYILFMTIPIVILTTFLFVVPSFSKPESSNYSMTNTSIYVAFIYVFWGMLYTVVDVPFWSLPNVMTPFEKERGKLISISRLLNGIGSAVPMGIVIILGYFNITYETRYLIMVMVSSICGGLLLISSYFGTKERVKAVVIEKSIKKEVKALFKSKNMILVILMGILACGRYMIQAAGIHVSRYTFYIQGMEVLPSQSTVQTIISVCAAAGMFIAMMLTPILIKKFTYRKLTMFFCVLGGLSSISAYFVGIYSDYNLYYLIPFLFLSSLPLGVLNVVGYAMIGDCLDEIEVNTKLRVAGLGSACQSFVNKLGNAFCTAIIIIIYLVVGLNIGDIQGSSVVNPSLLSSETRNYMLSLVTYIPGLSMLVCLIPILFYDLTGKKKELITKKLQEMRESN